jgi:hypothetical protein
LYAGCQYDDDGHSPWLDDQLEAWLALAVGVHADELHGVLIGVCATLLSVDVLFKDLQYIYSFGCYELAFATAARP